MAELLYKKAPGEDIAFDAMAVLTDPELYDSTAADYPTHAAWLKKTAAEIAAGTKHALVAYYDDIPCGVIVYRRDEDDPQSIAIRNISVLAGYQRHLQHIGTSLLQSVEADALNIISSSPVIMSVDAKCDNKAMRAFLESQGYIEQKVCDLYGSGHEDVIFTKVVTTPSRTL